MVGILRTTGRTDGSYSQVSTPNTNHGRYLGQKIFRFLSASFSDQDSWIPDPDPAFLG
jgi:hypothetical protein